MKKCIFMFPGVGSQHVGMGKEFYENFPVVKDTFAEAGDILEIDMAHLCFSETAKEELHKLENSQFALLTMGVATFRLFMAEIGERPQSCLGHSLGEYSALCSAGVLTFHDALKIVKQRGKILNEIAMTQEGIMAWVINLDNQVVEKICRRQLKENWKVYVSAYDAPKQSSISGIKDHVLQTGRMLEKEGAIVYPLKLSGPFHSPLMKAASDEFKSVLQQYTYNKPVYPVIANYNAGLYEGNDGVIDNLALQLMSPIRWQDSVNFLIKEGINIAFELGPDRVLKHLLQNNTDLIRAFSIGNMKDLEKVKNIG